MPEPVRIIAHRGESYLAPENTMAAFTLAWALGDEAVEADIHLSADGEVVICHDADTLRTSGRRHKVVIADSPLAAIQTVDVGSFKDARFAGERCPTLGELMESVPSGRTLVIEIKSGVDVVGAFADVVRRLNPAADRLEVISFHADALEECKQRLPEYQHHYLAGHKKDVAAGKYLTAPGVGDWIATARRVHADGLALCACAALDEAGIRSALASGLDLRLWTIDDPATARRYIAWGARSIISNRAHWLRGQIAIGD